MERYSEYKDSGVQWLGKIPKGWEAEKISSHFRQRNEKVSDKDYQALSVSKNGVTPQLDNVALSNAEGASRKLVKVGDYAVNSRSDRKGSCGVSSYEGSVSLITIVLEPFNVYGNYIHYLFRSNPWIEEFYRNGRGIVADLWTTNYQMMKSMYLPIPPLHEQHSIVSFLDSKCSKIDEWISKKQKEVELLGEAKQRIIADSVTRGLNPDVRMKKTGIAWLEEVPEHWEMEKVSSHFRQRNEKVSDKDFPALSVSKKGVTPQLDNVALSNAEGASRKLVKVGDYAVNSRSDRKGSCGVSAYEGSVSLITIVLEPFDMDGLYIHYLFRSTPWVEEFYRNGRGIVADLWTTNYQMMKGMYLPVPPLSEQQAIVSYITSKTTKIDSLMSSMNKEIEHLKEYNQRLISDVVTGQIKVC